MEETVFAALVLQAEAKLKTLFDNLDNLSKKLTDITNASVASPAIMYEFGRAMKDLSATVGAAFTPFFEIMTRVTRQVAGELYPAMKGLGEVGAELAQVFGAVLVPLMNVFSEVLQAFTPLFKALGDFAIAYFPLITALFVGLAAAIKTIADVIVRGVSELISVFLGGAKLTDLWKELRNVTMEVIRGLAVFSAMLARAFGLTEFTKNLIAGLSNIGKKEFAVAAPDNVHISGLEGIGKDLAVAAAGAVGTTTGKELPPGFDETIRALKDIQAGGNAGYERTARAVDLVRNAVETVITEIQVIGGLLPHPAGYDRLRNEIERGRELDRRIQRQREKQQEAGGL